MSGWWDEAACRPGVVPVGVVFFGGDRVRNEEAKVVCGGCAVRGVCLVDQLDYERSHRRDHPVGVFGGMSGPEREVLLDAERAARRVAVAV